jgi:hypothetical protein
MYPRNAATPPRIAIGAVVQISDGAVQSSGVSVVVRAEGGSESAGGGTVSYGGSSGIVYYAPTQAETNYTAFVAVAYKTGCIPVAANVITSKSDTSGYAGLDWGQVLNKTTANDLTGTNIKTDQKVDVNTIKTQTVTAAAGVTVLASVGTAATSTAQTGDSFARIGAPAGASVSADVAAVKADTAAIKVKTDFLPSVVAGGSGGVLISGTNSGTTTLGALTVTGATTHTGATTFTGAITGSNASNNLRINGVAPGAAGGVFIAGTNAATSITTALTANITGNLSGSVGSVTGHTPQTGDSFARIGATGSGLTSLASAANLATVAGYIDTEVAAIKAVTDALPDAGALTSLATASALATVDGIVDAILVDTAEIGAAGAGLTVLATQSLLTTVAGYLDTEIAAIKAKTDNLPASPAAVSDIPTAADVADAVWDEAIAGHAGSGSTGEALAAAGASGDPWITALPGSYTAGQAGYIVGTNLDAAVSSVGGGSSDWDADERTAIRSILGIPASGTTPDDPSAGILDTIRDGVVVVKAVTDALPDSGALTSIATAAALATVDSNVDAILVDTAEIGAAGAGLTALASAANLATVAGYIDTEISDIQSRLPAALVSGRMSSDLVSIGGSTTALTAFKSAVQGNVIATVGSASSTTSIVTSSMTPAPSVTDQLKGRILTFKDDTTTAALRGQATDITGSTASGTPTLTVTALTTAPASGDTFTIT